MVIAPLDVMSSRPGVRVTALQLSWGCALLGETFQEALAIRPGTGRQLSAKWELVLL